MFWILLNGTLLSKNESWVRNRIGAGKTTFPSRLLWPRAVFSYFRVCHVTLRLRYGGSRGAGKRWQS